MYKHTQDQDLFNTYLTPPGSPESRISRRSSTNTSSDTSPQNSIIGNYDNMDFISLFPDFSCSLYEEKSNNEFIGPPPGLCVTENSFSFFQTSTLDKQYTFNNIDNLISILSNAKNNQTISFDLLKNYLGHDKQNFNTIDQMLNHFNQIRVSRLDKVVSELIKNFIENNKTNIDAKLNLDKIPQISCGSYTFSILRKIECSNCRCKSCLSILKDSDENSLQKASEFFSQQTQKNKLAEKHRINIDNLKRKIVDILTEPKYCISKCEVIKVTFNNNMSIKEVVDISIKHNLIKRFNSVIKIKKSRKTQFHPLEQVCFPGGVNDNYIIEKIDDFEFSST